ncbi:hypothetical protein F5Y18DRAFT_154579 [Xylariaceae sp. FL1019]|nr:hypothetical protein F5Y18DRAFT_154579 [Xylariaceae sp. FL1019]
MLRSTIRRCALVSIMHLTLLPYLGPPCVRALHNGECCKLQQPSKASIAQLLCLPHVVHLSAHDLERYVRSSGMRQRQPGICIPCFLEADIFSTSLRELR